MNGNNFAIAMALAGLVLHSTLANGAEVAVSSPAKPAGNYTEEMIKARDLAAIKAFAAWMNLRAAGVTTDLGFDLARSQRDAELTAAKDIAGKAKAYTRHLLLTQRIELILKDQLLKGPRVAEYLAIARFEVLRARVEALQAQKQLVAADEEQSTIRSYEQALTALQSERRKLKAGGSTWSVVDQVARDLRDQELQMSATQSQKVAALARYAAVVHEIEEYATADTDRAIARKSVINGQTGPKDSPANHANSRESDLRT